MLQRHQAYNGIVTMKKQNQRPQIVGPLIIEMTANENIAMAKIVEIVPHTKVKRSKRIAIAKDLHRFTPYHEARTITKNDIGPRSFSPMRPQSEFSNDIWQLRIMPSAVAQPTGSDGGGGDARD